MTSEQHDRARHLENLSLMADQSTWKHLRDDSTYVSDNPAVNYLWFLRSERFEESAIEKQMIDFKVIPEFITHWSRQGASLDVNFERKSGEKHKLGVWAMLSVNSPRIRIVTRGNEKKYLTLVMLDFDRPNHFTGYYEEFCHWLVTDIEATGGPVEFEPRLSRYIGPEYPKILSRLKHYESDELLIAKSGDSGLEAGREVLPYLPLHPSLKNPKSSHRYIFAVYEQQSPNSNISVEEINRVYGEEINAVDEHYDGLVSTYSALEDQVLQERKMLFPLRSACLPAAALAKRFNLKLLTARFVVSKYHPAVGIMFDLLGIREPAFLDKNVFKDTNLLMQKIANSISAIRVISKEAQETRKPLAGIIPPPYLIPRRHLDALNSGSKIITEPHIIPSRIGMLLNDLRNINQITRIKKYNMSELPYGCDTNRPEFSSIALAAIIKSRRLKRASSMIDLDTNSLKEPLLNPALERVPSTVFSAKKKDIGPQHYVMPSYKRSG